jgi:hypothetical protein
MQKRGGLALLFVLAGACGQSPPRVSSTPGQSAPPGATVAPSASGSAGRTAPTLVFDDVQAELARACDPGRPATSNQDMSALLGADVDCRRAQVGALLAELRAPTGAAWDAYRRDACWVAVESERVDFEAGARDEGESTLVPSMTCDMTGYEEQYFFLRALRAHDAAAVAARATAVAEQGRKGDQIARKLNGDASVLLAKPPAPLDPSAQERGLVLLDGAARRELVDRSQRVLDGAASLGKATCDGWPELARGTSSPCEGALTLYFLSQVSSK